ncbi:MAG: complex I NDUFA9 subunit family protein [Burkholderiales bacterium]|nr:complex I NDUFA9 subunit family protein [Burkholderiales bacterium]
MTIRSVLVIGGTGFIGRHVVRQLSALGLQVRIPTRRRERARELILLPTVDVVQADVHDEAVLHALVASADAVINLVGILHGDFQRAHIDLPRRVVAACGEHGVRRLIHVSALKAAADAPSAYLRSKAQGEAVIRAADARIDATIMRPSVVFGPEDHFLNLFATLVRRLPVLALACPQARFRPVYVHDLARVMVAALHDAQTFGQTYELCGPRIYTLRELVEYVMATIGVRRPVIGLGPALSMLQATMLEHLPGRLMTRDNVLSMRVDNVCAGPFPDLFGIEPTPLEAVAPMYIGGVTPRSRYRWFRYRARR